MVSRPELGSDPPFGSGRESGRDIYKLYSLCLGDSIVRQTLFLAPLFSNVIKNNIIRPVIHIIVCLPKTE